MPRHAHNRIMSRGIGILILGMLCLLFFSACRNNDNQSCYVDMLNEKSYAFHYRNLDSTKTYAMKAYALADDYGAGRAEAMNNMAFVHIANMEYELAHIKTTRKLLQDQRLQELCERCLSYFWDMYKEMGGFCDLLEELIDDMGIDEEELVELFHEAGFEEE